jgi:uncharacterized phage-associated protein
MPLVDIFDEKKAAQVAAYFLFRSGNQAEMSVLKLMKLLYLSERRSYELYSEPLIGDRLVSMPHGPVLSITYNHMNGELADSTAKGWSHMMKARSGNSIGLHADARIESPEKELLELSDSELQLLSDIWKDFGWMKPYQIRDYTHEHCPEWVDPNGSMIPMTFGDLFEALEFSRERYSETLSLIEEKSTIAHSFKQACA